MVDIDGDGDLDIMVCNYDSPVQVFLNDGSGRKFVDRAAAMGLAVTDASLMPFFADYDRDGDLDLYLMTNRLEDPDGRPEKPPVVMVDGKPRIKPGFEKYYFLKQTAANKWEADLGGRPDYLFRNDGPGPTGVPQFTDVTAAAGMTERGHGLSAIWWDYDRDGWVDLFVANDFNDPDRLYRNNRDGTFTDVAADHLPHTAWFSMGSDLGDMNGDGLFDLFTTDMAATTHYKAKISMGNMSNWRWGLENFWPRQAMRNNFFLNTGTGRFMEIAYLTGLASTDWTWGVRLADLDNDGRNDLFFTNGAARYFNHADLPATAASLIGQTSWDPFKDKEPLKEQNLAFRNLGDLRFENTTTSWGLGHVGVSMGVAQGDLDNDGDLDLVVANLDEPVTVYRNNSAGGNSLRVRLQGRPPNTGAVGAVVTVEAEASGKQVRLANPFTGFQASNDPALHFGLGEDTVVNRLTVRWPGGAVETHEGIAANQLLTLRESPDGAPADKGENRPTPQFEEVAASVGLRFKHVERPFDDYWNQPLLPGKLSQLGGGLAFGDADGDGDDDLFVAGAAGQSGALFVCGADGAFTRAQGEFAWEADAESEGMTPLWFDVDSDGDLDLFVANGTSEFPGKSRNQQDRIYLNESGDGGLRFVATPILTIPVYGGANGPAVTADFDGDGDLDLFIGGRVVPGEYPVAPGSHLLRNDSRPGEVRFTDVTEAAAPGLRHAGLVTGALFSDATGDGRPDLLLTLEWGPVKLFVNEGDGMTDATASAGLEARSGWWNSITGTDIEGDGDLDYVVMNVGWNTKYGHPKPGKPAVLFYGDMEKTGKKRLVEAKPGKDHREDLLPVRGRSCSSHAMPSLAGKFPTFESFARAHLAEIYTPDCLESAQRFAADTFESGVLVNDGRGKFEWRPFPRMAQASPGYGVVASDLDMDGHPDVCAVQNFYTREPETGLWRGGIGLVLAGSGSGTFTPRSPVESGFVVDGDGKGLALCDLDNDGWPDLVATQNNESIMAFRNRGRPGQSGVAVRLRGPKGNLQGIGARVRVHYSDGSGASGEISGGGGYLSQSAPVLFFARRSAGGGAAEKITVGWPGGREVVVPVPASEPVLVIPHPAL
ncbi:MAG: RNA-binding protein [Akkermansiaceae bacterium]|nr:RNA-binding protein [Akkermansiaceae bacterium]